MARAQDLPIHVRILRAVTTDANGCWTWEQCIQSKGYGCIGVNKKVYLAHRVSYEAFVGPIPEGMQIDHKCRNRACVNPDHLEAVSASENNARGFSPSAINARRTHCVNGHPFDEANTIVKRSGKRNCRTCQNAFNRASAARRREQMSAAA